MDLAPYIRELVLLNECVILPEFGGFETTYSAARYEKNKQQMLPPTKEVQFRQDFIRGGGVLEDHLMNRLNINEEQATHLIEEYVADIRDRLDKTNEAMISGVGLFTKGLGGLLNFSPFEGENYLADSFGLDALPFEQAAVAKPEKPEVPELEIRPRRYTLQFVLIGVSLISILLIITVFISSRLDLYLFNFGSTSGNDDMIIIGNSSYDTTYTQIDNTIRESTDLRKALHYSEADEVDQGQTIDKFFLIAGSFKTLKNAEFTRNELIEEGYMPSIIENQGFYRVTIGSYPNKQEALNELQRLRRQIDRSIWLLQI